MSRGGPGTACFRQSAVRGRRGGRSGLAVPQRRPDIADTTALVVAPEGRLVEQLTGRRSSVSSTRLA